jgi:hypothetical protein
MIRPPNDWPDKHCAACIYFHSSPPPGPCNKHPGLTTDATSGACWDFHPHGIRHPSLCPDCTRFLIHGNRLLCGAYQAAEAPANLHTCPSFSPRAYTPQPSGD